MSLSQEEKLAQLLGTHPLGQLTMLNFVDGVANNSIGRDIAKDFILEWSVMSSGAPSATAALGKMRSTREARTDFIDKPGQKTPRTPSVLYTVQDYVFFRQLIDASCRGGALAPAEEIIDELQRKPEAEWPSLEQELVDLGEIAITLASPHGLKRSPDALIWFSDVIPGEPLRQVECCNSLSVSAADTARDCLGLVHYTRRPSDLPPIAVALKIPAAALPNHHSIWRPTPIDAENHSRFRGAYGDLRKEATEWGHAVHLQAISDRTGDLGSPEGVTKTFHPPTLHLSFLGYARVPNNDGSGMDAAFVQNVARRRQILPVARKTSISERFLAICN